MLIVCFYVVMRSSNILSFNKQMLKKKSKTNILLSKISMHWGYLYVFLACNIKRK